MLFLKRNLLSPAVAGPKGKELVRSLLNMKGHYVGEYQRLFERFGPVFYLPFPRPIIVFNAKEAACYFLRDRWRFYKKSEGYQELLPLLGEGLLNSEGEKWVTQRRMVGSKFVPRTIKSYAAIIIENTEILLDSWEKSPKQKTRRVSFDFMDATFKTAAQIVFGKDAFNYSGQLEETISLFLERAIQRSMSIVKLPNGFPTPKSLKVNSSMREWDKVIQSLIDKRKLESSEEQGDLLGLLLSVQDQETHQTFSDKELKSQIMTLLVAGHETTGSTLSWMCYLLSEHPEIQEKCFQEVNQQIGNSRPSADDAERLPFINQVILETMRIFPPGPNLPREAVSDDEFEGLQIKKGLQVEICSYGIHKNKKYWNQPESFDPSRFETEKREKIPEGAYIPFGLGPRKCIGENLAMLELRLMAAMLIRSYRFKKVPGFSPKEQTTITLKPRDGMELFIEARGP
jgi:cytochrome P450